MRELRLVAVSEDGTHLILRTDGEESSWPYPSTNDCTPRSGAIAPA